MVRGMVGGKAVGRKVVWQRDGYFRHGRRDRGDFGFGGRRGTLGFGGRRGCLGFGGRRGSLGFGWGIGRRFGLGRQRSLQLHRGFRLR